MQRLVPAAEEALEDDGPLPISPRVAQMRDIIARTAPLLRRRIEELVAMVRDDHTLITRSSRSMLRVWSLDSKEDHFRDATCPPFLCCCCCLWSWCMPRRWIYRIVATNSMYICLEPSYLRLVYTQLSDKDILKCLAIQSQIIVTSLGSPMVVLRTQREILLAWKDRDLVAQIEVVSPPPVMRQADRIARAGGVLAMHNADDDNYPSIM